MIALVMTLALVMTPISTNNFQDTPAKAEIPMINVPGQRFKINTTHHIMNISIIIIITIIIIIFTILIMIRFTATHGIKAKKGEQKLFL